ncbi:MAG: FAD-binding protein [Sediminimonas qiaohouensis]|uniref:FAD-binding protein n=1 Tax=Sediminimonas qiaohouensis TaxID=552061 RepID=A0A7C9HBF7_9RHOB|nr:FAD-binding protein [Sediminimonas qiaohouensis]MTJ05010.1 FAD-binding protein [Sediminimonas qiaohouensis]
MDVIETEVALAERIRDAQGPIRVLGGGTRAIGRPVQGEALSVAGLSGVVDYETGALTLVVKAGTPLDEIEQTLAADGQRLAFEPMDHRGILGVEGMPTIGGVVAGNVSGPRRIAVGACRDFLLGVRFVDGAGRILKNGGRVMKNVTGYDLVRLMAGSRGTLGVLSEISLKVLPTPETVATLSVHGAEGGGALDAMTRAITSPFEVTGAAHVPGSASAVHLRLEGFSGSVAYRVEQLKSRLSDLGEVTVETAPDSSAELWRKIRDVEPLQGAYALWRVSMKPSAVYAGLLPAMSERAQCDYLMDWAGGECWIALSEKEAASLAKAHGGDDAADGAAWLHRGLQEAVADRQINQGGGGHATLIKGPEALRGAVSVFQPEPAPVAALTAGLRQKFDPKGILNPGLMG